MFGRISVTLIFITFLFVSSYGDFPQLHRALPGANGKPGYRVTSSQSARIGDNNIQNKHGMGTDKKEYGQDQQKTMDFESQWSQAAAYSIFSCILVGLSGIFPLIVIPLEAGPSLKYGGKSASNAVKGVR